MSGVMTMPETYCPICWDNDPMSAAVGYWPVPPVGWVEKLCDECARRDAAIVSDPDALDLEIAAAAEHPTTVCLHCGGVKLQGNDSLPKSHGLHEGCDDAYREAHGFPPKKRG